jgi:hypothetical protein
MSRVNWAAYGACAWALAFAVMSFYWAAGGLVAIDTIGGEPERLARARDPEFVAAQWIIGEHLLMAVGVVDRGDLDDTALIGHLAFWDPWWILGAGLFVIAAWQLRRNSSSSEPREPSHARPQA